MERSVVVLYGSQTGTAQEFAEHAFRQALRRRFSARISAMNDFHPSNLLTSKLVLFVCSTTGQGDPPDNMTSFWRFLLRKNLPSNSLSDTHFAIIGLGDSSYAKFNATAKRLEARLLQLGAHLLCERCDGDDQHPEGADGAILPWLDEFWKRMESVCVEIGGGEREIPEDVLLPPKYCIKVVEEGSEGEGEREREEEREAEKHAVSEVYPFEAKVILNERLTAEDHWQDVRRFGFDIRDSGIHYSPGDILCIAPKTSDSHCLQLCQRLSIDPNTRVIISHTPYSSGPILSPRFNARYNNSPVTVLDLLRETLGTEFCPRRYVFEVLRHFDSDELEIDRLEHFASVRGQQDLYRYCIRERRTLLDILNDFRHAKPPLEYLLDILPVMYDRQFSISSAESLSPGEMYITAAIVRYETPYKRKIEAKDYLYGDRFQKWKEMGILSDLNVAFSRDQEDKVYVWHLMKAKKEKLAHFLTNSNGNIYVAGNSKQMPKNVMDTFIEILDECTDMNESEAQIYMRRLEVSGRYQCETWS